jgi:hypothetical protein
MKRLSVIIILAAVMAAACGCEFKKNVSRDEIPIIKESVTAFENILKARNLAYLDSILSTDAAEVGTTPESIMEFVYGDGLTEFVGFSHKQIYFRGNSARIDGKITGPDGPTREVTITMRKHGEVWLLKKIEPRVEDAGEDDSSGT